MSYPNAILTLRHRLNATQLVVEEDLLIGDVTARFQVVYPPVSSTTSGVCPARRLAGQTFSRLV